ncbi:MAG: hypothetical protein WGN25_16880 [Candidatus Electrothrix sp. GW3-4]|uniref:hypothetical protein n=1 Tax=Candidatus Electrothrix sp. GW3-4 TaxID=3126740 RepID=UPI0030CF2DC0
MLIKVWKTVVQGHSRLTFDDLVGIATQAGDGEHDINYEDLEFSKAKQAVDAEEDLE